MKGSIAYNISPYGCEEASLDDIKKAAVVADIDGYISSLPEGRLQRSENGEVTLSGGQRQRIAIARNGRPRDPLILLMDEATVIARLHSGITGTERHERGYLRQDFHHHCRYRLSTVRDRQDNGHRQGLSGWNQAATASGGAARALL